VKRRHSLPRVRFAIHTLGCIQSGDAKPVTTVSAICYTKASSYFRYHYVYVAAGTGVGKEQLSGLYSFSLVKAVRITEGTDRYSEKIGNERPREPFLECEVGVRRFPATVTALRISNNGEQERGCSGQAVLGIHYEPPSSFICVRVK
jgi:hypothetical protein